MTALTNSASSEPLATKNTSGRTLLIFTQMAQKIQRKTTEVELIVNLLDILFVVFSCKTSVTAKDNVHIIKR